MINRNMKNAAIIEAMPEIKALLDAGRVVILDKVATSNPDYMNIYLMANVAGVGAEATAAEQMLLGWDGAASTTLRCIQNAKTEIVNGLELGTPLPEGFTFRVYDVTTPEYKGHNQRQNKDGDLLHTEDGLPIFRNTKLVSYKELEDNGHDLVRKTVKKAKAVIKPTTLLAKPTA